MMLPGVSPSGVTGERAQTHTLEAFTASIFILMVVAVIITSMGVVPGIGNTAATENAGDNRQVANDALSVASQQGTLDDMVLHYDTANTEFINADGPDGAYTSAPSGETEFGGLLETVFENRDLAFNLDVTYMNSSGEGTQTTEIVHQGEPSSAAATASRTVFIFEDDTLGDGSPVTDNFYMPNSQTNDELYNVATVELTVWRL